MKKHRSRKMISSIYNSTAILREAHGKQKPSKKQKHHPTPDDIPKWKLQKAGDMRANPTSLERILYAALQRKFPNPRPRVNRQEIVYGYILDATIPHLRLCLEADGPMHDPIRDRIRDRHLLKWGQIRTIRFSIEELALPETELDVLLHAKLYPKKR
jgi:very-short-patch-repair endonuclease